MTDRTKIVNKFEEIKDNFNEDEIEDLTGLLAIYVNNMRPNTEDWKRLKTIISRNT